MKIWVIELREHRMGISSSSSINSLMPPILAVWAERSGWKAEVSFLEFAEIDYSNECDVVALGIYTFLSARGYQAARRFREAGKIVIIGGPHTKGCAKEAAQHADLVFDCCDEATWRSTLGEIEAGGVGPNTIPGRIVKSSGSMVTRKFLFCSRRSAVLTIAIFAPTRVRLTTSGTWMT